MAKKIPSKPLLVKGQDGRKRHPLVDLMASFSNGEIAKALGHKNHTTVSIYVNKARRKPTQTIPAEWVPPLCRLTGWAPAMLRPDLYQSDWRFFLPVDNANKAA